MICRTVGGSSVGLRFFFSANRTFSVEPFLSVDLRYLEGDQGDAPNATDDLSKLPEVKRMEIETFGGFSLSFRFTEAEAHC